MSRLVKMDVHLKDVEKRSGFQRSSHPRRRCGMKPKDECR